MNDLLAQYLPGGFVLHTTTTATTTTTTTTATTPLQETLHVRESERVADNSARPDASMTSVDSGVETGNDSNDSIVVTANITSAATAIGQHAANNSVTTITTTSAVNKQHQEQHRCEHQEAGPSFIRIDWPPSVTSEILKFPLPLTALKESYLKTFEYSNECYISSGIPSGLMSPELNQIASVCGYTKNLFDSKYDNADPVCCIKTRRQNRKWFWKNHMGIRGLLSERRMRMAAATNNIQFMETLLQNGVSPNNHDEYGRTPLHHAACRGYTEMVLLLLKYGANPNKRDCIGNTPLHLAAVTSKISVVTLLLTAGTDILLLDHYGYNPLQLAQTKLKMIQVSNNEDMEKMKTEMHSIVEMLVAYLQKQTNMRDQVETLSNFCSRLSLSNTSDQVQDDVKDLLANIESLSIT